MLFRIIQEGLTNIRKHSGATRVSLNMDFHESSINVTIGDNGVGFEIPAGLDDLTMAGKLGLVGMQERAQLLGGTMDIKSQPGQGTTLAVDIPL
jgi:signal transduction histidine kinase